MADKKPSRLRQHLHLYVMFLLAILLAWTLYQSLASREADYDLEHGPEAEQQLEQALKDYRNKNKPAAD